MTVTATYAKKTFQVTVNKEDLKFLLDNGFIRKSVTLGNLQIDAGFVELTVSVKTQEVLREIVSAEDAAYKQRAPQEPAPELNNESEVKDAEEPGTTADGPADAADHVH